MTFDITLNGMFLHRNGKVMKNAILVTRIGQPNILEEVIVLSFLHGGALPTLSHHRIDLVQKIR
jgi:hypothetical protein